ncbi:MAG TPA: M20/M25/M40 family metallo-hydrolase, partial [bacterium]
FILIEQVCRELFPDTPIVPYLSPGMSDGTRLRRAGIPTYGLLPFPLDENETGRLHGKDERVSIEALMTGLKLVYRLAELAGK